MRTHTHYPTPGIVLAFAYVRNNRRLEEEECMFRKWGHQEGNGMSDYRGRLRFRRILSREGVGSDLTDGFSSFEKALY